MSGELTMEAIEASLGELVKAADATDLLRKTYGGVAVDEYGHHDERGDTHGGLADSGDMGPLDSMMIGKMGRTLAEAGFPASAISAFMAAFNEDEDEDDEDEDMDGKMGRAASTSGGVATNPRVRASGGSTKKSMDALRADAELSDSLDVSPFLESLTARMADQLDAINKSLYATASNQAGVNRAQAVATYNLGQLVKSIAGVTDALAGRLGLIEATPQPQRGYTQLSGAQPMNKAMPYEAGAPAAGMQLAKSHVLSALSYMNLEKGIREIAGRPTSELIGTYEAGGQLSQQTFDAVQGFLAAHPHEAETAVTYR